MLEELKATAKFEKGERVRYHGAPWFVVGRYWRRSTDEILYDLREDLGKLLIKPKTARKIPERDIAPHGSYG